MTAWVHPTAEIEAEVELGAGTRVWAYSQIRRGARIGTECSIGRNVFIDVAVAVGDRCKIQNNALLYAGLRLEEGVFVGPAVCFTNDRYPRAITPTGALKEAADWTLGETLVEQGAAIGAGAVIVTGVRLGRFCLVGSGSVVTRDVPAYTLVVGQPARAIGAVCRCARRLVAEAAQPDHLHCPACGRGYQLVAGELQEEEAVPNQQ